MTYEVADTSIFIGGGKGIIGRREIFYQRCIRISIYFRLVLLGVGRKYYREERNFLSKMHMYFYMLWSSVIGG